MVPELRPRGIGEILDTAVALYRARFTRLARVAAAVVIPVQALSAIVLISARPDSISFGVTGSVTPHYDSNSFATQLGAIVVVLARHRPVHRRRHGGMRPHRRRRLHRARLGRTRRGAGGTTPVLRGRRRQPGRAGERGNRSHLLLRRRAVPAHRVRGRDPGAGARGSRRLGRDRAILRPDQRSRHARAGARADGAAARRRPQHRARQRSQLLVAAPGVASRRRSSARASRTRWPGS